MKVRSKPNEYARSWATKNGKKMVEKSKTYLPYFLIFLHSFSRRIFHLKYHLKTTKHRPNFTLKPHIIAIRKHAIVPSKDQFSRRFLSFITSISWFSFSFSFSAASTSLTVQHLSWWKSSKTKGSCWFTLWSFSSCLQSIYRAWRVWYVLW